jgi:hypothetical protein
MCWVNMLDFNIKSLLPYFQGVANNHSQNAIEMKIK